MAELEAAETLWVLQEWVAGIFYSQEVGRKAVAKKVLKPCFVHFGVYTGAIQHTLSILADNGLMLQTANEIAQTAARLVVDEGLEYAQAKRRALKQLGLPSHSALPDNMLLEQAVREHLAIFCAETQPAELAALRALAAQWMQRLNVFAPLLGGAVWRGTATRLSDIYLQLFTDDPKAVELELINAGTAYEVNRVTGLQSRAVDALSLHVWCEGLQEEVGLHLLVNDTLAQRGSMKSDAQGQKLRGTLAQLQTLMQAGSSTLFPTP